MAKSCTLALPLPIPQPKNMNQILSTQLYQKNRIISSWTRIISSLFSNPISKNKNTSYNLKYYVLKNSRGLTNFSTSPSLLPLCQSHLSSLGFFTTMSHNAQHELGPTVPQDSTKTIRCVIKGRVQGVFYRNWTIENATQLGLKGWVRNRRDGSVEALFSGKTESVDEMLQHCRRGPPDAMVTALEANPSQEFPGDGFDRKPTV